MANQSADLGKSLSDLKIDRNRRRKSSSGWAKWWILVGVAAFLLFGLWRWFFSGPAAVTVQLHRVEAQSGAGPARGVALNASGYVVPHHKIEVASKVSGKVAWIGVEKGDDVKQGQVVVRLEDDEFQARVRQAKGNLAALEARLAELEAGSRPEEIARAKSNLAEARADLAQAKLDLERAKGLFDASVIAKQEFDAAQARTDAQQARVESLDQTYQLAVQGPRREEIESVRGQVQQAIGQLEYDRTLLDATVIRAPVTGTILERNVEMGEFVTTSFVGERGAKGYAVSLADLNDLQVELDISQDDFARLRMGHPAVITTDAFRDREYQGEIVEISPEADRQKATVQVKVQIHGPDEFLRPEMNANVAFLADQAPDESASSAGRITVPSGAVEDGRAWLYVNGRAVARTVETGRTTPDGIEIVSGLSGGEDVILSPPAGLADGAPVEPAP